jgi:dsDNA-binding SOS-regulon protein
MVSQAMVSRAEANAYDRIIDAAAELFELIEGAGIELNEMMLEELTIYLAKNAAKVREIVKKIPAQYFLQGE